MAAVAAIALLSPATQAGGPLTLRTAGAGVELLVGDIAGNGDNIAVAWHEEHPAGSRAHLRVSRDGGLTFAPRVRVGNDQPQVDVCGGAAWALSVASLGVPGNRDLGLYRWDLGDGSFLPDSFLGFDNETDATQPDLACVGDRVLAGVWFDASTNPAHVEMLVREFAFCGDECPPGIWRRFDLGLGRAGSGLSVAATSSAIYVAWMKGQSLRFKRFAVGPGAAGPVTPEPTVTIVRGRGVLTPLLAASGSTVVLGFANKNDARVKVSHDGGDTFGPVRTYVDGPTVGSAFAFPTSVDVRGSRLLAEGTYVLYDSGPIEQPPYVLAWRSVSADGGAHWSDTARERHGIQKGALFWEGGTTLVAEAWDQSLSAATRQELRFQR